MDITVGDFEYRTGRLNAFQQLHVSRRLAPFFAVLGDTVMRLAKMPDAAGSGENEQKTLDRFMGMIPAAADIAARMPEDDVNYILVTCLSVCARKVGNGYMPILAGTTSPPTFQFNDITMDQMLKLATEVCRENLAGFLKGLGGTPPSPSS